MLRDFSLRNHNTLQLPCQADTYLCIDHTNQVTELSAKIKTLKLPVLIMGGGSNVVLPEALQALVIHINTKGIDLIHEDQNHVYITAQAGEVWHDFVKHCVKNQWWGIENLALIPGQVGASPVQNIGAYGTEVKDVIDSVELVDLDTGELKTLSNQECEFSYRNSIFKQHLSKWLIMSVTFKLHKHWIPNVRYPDIQRYLQQENILSPNPQQIFDAVCAIRRHKLPDPAIVGNAGSFFKNPIISRQALITLQTTYPDIVFYELGDQQVKLAAGWLIDKAGWKGQTLGEAGVHDKQALVLINTHNQATQKDILNLALAIQKDILDKFGVQLDIEPLVC